MRAVRSTPTSLDGIDLTDLDNFASGFPHQIFTFLRANAPVWWHRPTANTPGKEGFWVVSSYAGAMEVLHDPMTFSSETGGSRPFGGTILEDLPVSGVILNMMDDPRHHRIRQLVNKGFTPRAIATLESELRHWASQSLDRVGRQEEVDFLEEVAAELPMAAIALICGVPEKDRGHIYLWANVSLDYDDRNLGEQTRRTLEAGEKLRTYGAKLISSKLAEAGQDVLSVVAGATMPDEDPPRLTSAELEMFFSLLMAAGSDTTRNAIAGGILAFIDHPEQWQLLRSDPSLVPTAIEEILRWTAPAAYNRRTATADVVFHGARIHAGDKVTFWEASANRDESVFDDPFRFDISRDPNPHVSFGHGTHHCLGANLARLEIRVVLDEMRKKFTGFELVGPVEWTRSNKHTGIRHMRLKVVS